MRQKKLGQKSAQFATYGNLQQKCVNIRNHINLHKISLCFLKNYATRKNSGTAGLEGPDKDQLWDDTSVFKCYLKKAGTATLNSENQKSQIAQGSSQMFQYKTKFTQKRLRNVFPILKLVI